MANNRMVLLCNVCIPLGKSWKYGEEGVRAIAKWYPGMSYADHTDFNDFLIDHNHPEFPSETYKAGAGQPNPVRLEYELVDEPVIEQWEQKTLKAGWTKPDPTRILGDE